MGVSWHEFWGMNPHIINLITKGYQEKIREKDYLAWLFNQYTLSAVSVATEHCLAGKRAKSKYIEEPLLSKVFEKNKLTQDEIQQKEIKKAILAEQQYIAIAFSKGLPETIIL